MPRPQLKKRSDGRYVCREGKKFFYGKTQSEAYAKRDAWIREQQAGIRVENADKTFSEYAASWLPVYMKNVRTKNYNEFARMLQRASDAMQNPKLKDVTPTDIKAAYNSVEGMSKSYIAKFCSCLVNVFKTAVGDGAIIRNPTDSVARPKGPSGTHRALTDHEISIVRELSGSRFGPATMCMLYAGLRRGEVLYLDIDRDVDFEARTVTVRGAIAFDDGNDPLESKGKTANARRVIPLLAPLAECLEGRHGLVASKLNGETMSRSSFQTAWDSWKAEFEEKVNNGKREDFDLRIADQLAHGANPEDLPSWIQCTIRTHDFRHTFCTMLYEADVDIKTAQEWMGHAEPAMIMRIYAHLSEKKRMQSEMRLRSKLDEIVK